MPSFFIHLAPLIADTDLDRDDQGIAGVYEVQCDKDESDQHTVTAVLDAFHDKIGIASLDDFEVGVKNQSGQWVYESENEDDPDPLDMPRTRFMGGINETPERSSIQLPKAPSKPSL